MGRRNNQNITRIKDLNELNKRNIDRAYDWISYISVRIDVKFDF